MSQTTQELGADDPRAGLMTRMREALRQVADEVGARASIPVAVPGKEISEAMFRIFSDVPRVPDFDPEQAAATSYHSVVEFESDEVPPPPVALRVFVDEEGSNVDDPKVVLAIPAVADLITLDPDEAERLFLAGLAACKYARARSRYAAPDPVD
jgi:hypothetical protein